MPAPSASGRTPEFTPEPLRAWGKTWRVLVAILVGLIGLVSLAELPADRAFMVPVDLIFGVIVFTLMFFRRRWPFVVAVLSVILGSFSGLAAGAMVITIISLATRRRWVEVIPVGVLFVAGGSVYLALIESDAAPLLYVSSTQEGTLAEESFGPWWLMPLFLLLSFAVLAAIGFYIGARRELIFSLQQRVATAEREQVAREDQARTAERSRIAREMHDVLAHRISLVAMHSGALTYRTNLTGDEMQATAEIIRDNAHLALTELRDVLGVLRDSESGPEIAPPQPTLGSLPELVELTASTGTDVNLQVSRDTEEHLMILPEFTSRTAYRIVQEALTNVLKHAPGHPALVTVSGAPGDRLSIEVRNPTVSGPHESNGVVPLPPSGMGLTGLSERAALAGGELSHGVDRAEDFVVRAWLPWAN